MNEPSYKLLGDGPFTGADDPLEFHELADGIVTLLSAAHSSTPISLGIQASWGMGKSSLMHQLKKKLDTNPNAFKTVWFNAWTFDGEDILEGLIKTALEQIDPNVLRRALRNQNLMSAVQVATSIASNCLGIGELVNTLWERVKVDPRTRNQLKNVLSNAMSQWLKKTGDSSDEKMIVIFIDDLDRCSPESVFSVFEAIKLYLDAKGFAFVIGVDSDIVSEAILEKKKYSKRITSEQYIEKIIQIAYNIPPATPDQIRELFKRYSAESGTGDLFDDDSAQLVLERSNYNPRRIKRFINVFVMEHQLNPESRELEPKILIKIIMLGMYYRSFCRMYDAGNDQDLISEFLEYERARRTLSGRPRIEKADNSEFLELFSSYGLSPPEIYDEGAQAINALDDRMPEEFVRLGEQTAFINLVKSIDEADRHIVSAHIKRVGESVTPESAETKAVPLNLDNLRILWVDDQPEKNSTLVKLYEASGASIVQAPSTEEAIYALQKDTLGFNVIVSDVKRQTDRTAGFTGVDRIQKEGLFKGEVIFYLGIIRKEDRVRAKALGAEITNEPEQLGAFLSRIAQEQTMAAEHQTRELHPLRYKMKSFPNIERQAAQLLTKMTPDEAIKQLNSEGIGKAMAEAAVANAAKQTTPQQASS